jgi:hypothetical protein
VGANDTVLTADSAEATGMKWAAVGGATQNFSLLSNGTPTGSTYTVSGLSGYDEIMCVIETVRGQTVAGWTLQVRLNTDSSLNYGFYGGIFRNASAYSASIMNNTGGAAFQQISLAATSTNVDSTISGYFNIKGANTSGKKIFLTSTTADNGGGGSNHQMVTGGGVYNSSSVISSISFLNQAASFAAGNIKIYGAV